MTSNIEACPMIAEFIPLTDAAPRIGRRTSLVVLLAIVNARQIEGGSASSVDRDD
jgi:hypothetical protein